MKPPFLRTAYNYDTNEASDNAGLHCLDPSLAQQNFKDSADINVLMRKYQAGADIPAGFRMPEYGDFTGVDSYHAAANAVARAHEAFDALPGVLRARFQGDPAAFVAFCEDENNREEAIRLGLVPKPSGKVPEAPVGSPEPAGAPSGAPAPVGGGKP